MNKKELRIILITCFGHMMCHLYILIYSGAFKTIAKHFGVNKEAFGIAVTIGVFAFGLGALPAGLLATKTNAKFTLKLFFILSGAASLLTGLSPSLIVYTIGLVLIGLFGALYHVSGLTLITQGVEKKGKVMGIHGVAGSLGIAIGPVVAGFIIKLTDSWRAVYLLMAIPGIVGFLFLMFDKVIPNEHPEETASSGESAPSKSPLIFFILAVAAMGIMGFVYRGFLSLFPDFIRENAPVLVESDWLRDGIATIILSFGMIGQYVAGLLSDRFRLPPLYLVQVIISIPFMFLMGSLSGWGLMSVSTIFVMFHFSNQPVENKMIGGLMPARLAGSAYGIKFILTFGLGSFGAWFAGRIADKSGLAAIYPALVWAMGAAAVVIGILTVLDLRSKKIEVRE